MVSLKRRVVADGYKAGPFLGLHARRDSTSFFRAVLYSKTSFPPSSSHGDCPSARVSKAAESSSFFYLIFSSGGSRQRLLMSCKGGTVSNACQ